jgi:peptidoglycan hydrolase CwlO-like protein
MDTFGNVIDKLFTVNLKLKHNNEQCKIDNLQDQKSRLKNEIDNLANDILSGKLDDCDISRPQHKTY